MIRPKSVDDLAKSLSYSWRIDSSSVLVSTLEVVGVSCVMRAESGFGFACGLESLRWIDHRSVSMTIRKREQVFVPMRSVYWKSLRRRADTDFVTEPIVSLKCAVPLVLTVPLAIDNSVESLLSMVRFRYSAIESGIRFVVEAVSTVATRSQLPIKALVVMKFPTAGTLI